MVGEAADEEIVQTYALQLIKFRPRFSDELSWKLGQKGFAQELINPVLERLERAKIVDDAALLPGYIASLVERRRWSRRRISLRLTQLHLSKELIASGLEHYFNTHAAESTASLEALAAKKTAQLANFDPKFRRQKLIAFLAGRGYSWSEIKAAINKISEG